MISKRTAYIAIVTLGIVSLLGDTVYEAGRGIAPDYLMVLGASALLVGVVSGVGEFLGYTARLVTGSLADKNKAYWIFIFVGYGLILAIPLIGFTNSLELVIVLILLERLGKALRAPSRDTVVSILSKNVGSGKGFGVHGAIDQIGAVIGPLLFAGVLFFSENNYRNAYAILLIPFVLIMIVILYAYRKVGKTVENEVDASAKEEKAIPLSRSFWVYCFAVFLSTLGLIPVALILFKGSSILQPLGEAWVVPLLYVIVQAVDAPMALFSGFLFDKLGVKILVLPFVLSVFPALFVSYVGLTGVILACLMFGFVLGLQSSIYRASVCEFTPVCKRGKAYGVFNAVLGVGTLASGVIFGYFISESYSPIILFGFALLLQVGAIVTLRQSRKLISKDFKSRRL